jgi:uncharacterized membrane protein YdbT with pleckstrin-like domain
MLFGVWATSSLDGVLGDALGFVALAAIVLSAGWLTKQAVEWRFTYFVVTDDRIIYQRGVLARHSKSITIDKVHDVATNQSIFERFLGVGDVRIESGGEDGSSTFTDINRPIYVKNTINDLMRATPPARGGFVAAPSGEARDVVSQLERLEGLLDRGTITQDEFEAQKRRLLRPE